ncbi:MAG TPA: threonine synthase [Gemmatimonadales bacterium]|nr:threonine synthase [Gemmatimonadales bacterium]
MDWILECSGCGATRGPEGLPSVCQACQRPWLVRYPTRVPSLADRTEVRRGHGMWRFRPFLPLAPDERPISLGEGDTPLLHLARLGARYGFDQLWLKDEGTNPTGSFKSRGLSAAITRAVAAGAERFVIPTAGNAGVAAAAYGARAGARVRVYAPSGTPSVILDQIVSYGGELVLLDGHIGDCGREARAYASAAGAVDLSTLREPYRIEGKKTLGLEVAMQLRWSLPDAIVYPTGGGTGLIGMWKVFRELGAAGWVDDPPPRLYSVQASGCAPVVRAWERGADRCEPWPAPATLASGLRVPAPLGDRLILRALRETGGGAVAVSDDRILAMAREVPPTEGIDPAPEGAAALAGAVALLERGEIRAHERIVVFNTGAGWLYRPLGQIA